MSSSGFASKEIARSFYLHNRHVLLVQGSKPHNSEVLLVEDALAPGAARLMMRQPMGAGACTGSDAYYLVKPLFGKGPMRRTITLTHQAGKEAVRVEPLGCRANPSCPFATGSSQAFRFDEAFEDALRQLPIFQRADNALPLPLVDIVAIGALYGGFSGFSHLFLRLEAVAEVTPEGTTSAGA